MEYKTDKRTKNLTLRDIHVGDWVQVWSEETERYSPPVKITQICDDGTVYLIIDEENRLDPWEENIKDIDALPITKELLEGFGFKINNRAKEYNLVVGDDYELEYSLNAMCYRLRNTKCYRLNNWHCAYTVNEMQYELYRFDKYELKLEWKGVEK